MKLKTAILFAVLLSACSQKQASNNTTSPESKATALHDSLPSFSITNASAADFLKAEKSYKNKILYDTARVKKINGVIKLPIGKKGQSFMRYADTLPFNEGYKKYQYIGQFESIGYYILEYCFNEECGVYLVSKNSGTQTAIWNTPYISPNNKFIANLSWEYHFEGNKVGIQIWKVGKTRYSGMDSISVSDYLELKQLIWIPLSFAWETNNSLIIKAVDIDKYQGLSNGQSENNIPYYLRMRF